MDTFCRTDSYSSYSSSGSSTHSVGGGRAEGLRSSAQRLANNARKLNHATEGTPSNIEDTELSSRKVAWVENIKIHLKIIKQRIIIAFCNMRLHCHFYCDENTCKELKRTVREAEVELKILDSEQRRRIHVNKMKKELEDGEYVKAGIQAVQAGFHRVRGSLHSFLKETNEIQ